MPTHLTRKGMNLLAITALMLVLSACGTLDRLGNIGRAPPLSPMDELQTAEKFRSIALSIPADTAEGDVSEANSLWRTGGRAFFRDHRAANIGDIVTVLIDISDAAQVDNTTTRTRTTGESSNLTSFLGLESKLSDILPNAVSPGSLTDFGSTSSNVGSGSVDRSETINLTIAAIVTHILPNGNMVIQGRQEVRVNFEVRELWITGIIRPEDITNLNTVKHTQIAEARISYGGRGQLTEVQQARYGAQLFEILFPF